MRHPPPPCVSKAPFPNQPSPLHSPTERGQPTGGGFRVTRDPTPEAYLKPPGREGCCFCVLHEPASHLWINPTPPVRFSSSSSALCGVAGSSVFCRLLLLLPSAISPLHGPSFFFLHFTIFNFTAGTDVKPKILYYAGRLL